MNRVLPIVPFDTLDSYIAAGGGAGLKAARAVTPDTVIDELIASGLRGRGGAGFPTGIKWRTVRSFASPLLRTSVVVNAAEGEPGTMKDRAIIRANPYAVIEGALIAAHVMEARSVVVATKAAFTVELARLRSAISEVEAAGWAGPVVIFIVEGPSDYLLGEETALLEVIDGRPPFPRIAPPFRRGVVEVVTTRAEASSGSGLSATVQMAETEGQSIAPPVLVNNVETFANVGAIVANGASWFRSIGTEGSPGSIVCTVTGGVRHPGVVEVPMGTTIGAVIDLVGGMSPGRELCGVLVGVSSAVVTADLLDTELTHEAMAAIGSGLGSAGLFVIGDDVEPAALAAGVSRFLAVESCGQCTHCKGDGVEIATLLGRIATGDGTASDLATVGARLGTVADGARCGLAGQQQVVVGSLLTAFADRIDARLGPNVEPGAVYLVAPLVDIGEDGAVVDTSFADKQPDWTHDLIDSGVAPVDRLVDHRQPGDLPSR